MSTNIYNDFVRFLYMSTLSERITQVLREMDGPERGKQTRLATLADCTRGLVHQWLAGLNETMGYEYAKNIHAQLGWNVDWLIKGEGPAKGDSKFDRNVTPVAMGVRSIPVISLIQAGKMTEITDPYPCGAGFAVEYVDEAADYSPWTFGLEISGDSMLPDFRPGDRVIIDPELAPNPGDFVAARNSHEEATFKKYRPRGMDAAGNMVFELVPLNPDYPTMRSDIQHLQVIGVMVEHRKKFRRSRH